MQKNYIIIYICISVHQMGESGNAQDRRNVYAKKNHASDLISADSPESRFYTRSRRMESVGAYHGSGDSDSGGRPFYLHLYEDKGDIRRDLTAGYGVHDCLSDSGRPYGGAGISV